MTIGNFQSARVADSHRELGDDWSEFMFGPDEPTARTPAIQTNNAMPRPVLARIPDVTATLRTPRGASLRTDTDPVRVDPPTTRIPAGRHNEADRSRLCDGAIIGQRLSAPREAPTRRTPAKSNVLPSGNPFEIPRERLHERLQDSFAPVVRFLLLFVLFTAAGTSTLMIFREPATPESRPTKPSVATVDPSIAVPTAPTRQSRILPTLESLTTPPASSTNSTKVVSDTAPAVARSEARLTPYVERAETVADDEEEMPQTPAGETKQAPYPTTKFSPAKLPAAGEGPLPRIRTTEAPATARLHGVHQVPTR